MQSILTALLLPPVGLVWPILAGALLAWRGLRAWGLVTAAAALGLLALATPLVSGWLVTSLEEEVATALPQSGAVPGAIVVLGAEVVRTRDGRRDVGPLTLERLRAGAALHRATGLPLLVTGGLARSGEVTLAGLMAASLEADFRVPVRWREDWAADTRENAIFSAALLHSEGIGAVHLVTHAWHLPRAGAAFARAGLPFVPAPVRLAAVPSGRAEEWVPRADHLGTSWFALREWAGRLVYAVRDGGARR
ncbi:MAG TPA: YdcF family protein [Acetobacteraceae bacterium]|nr:YdcF family protein [Acetobacteraceae bacterium]